MKPSIAQSMARALLNVHGLRSWRIAWTQSVTVAGRCVLVRKTIQLSRSITLLNGNRMMREIILHEIAHALTPYHGHDIVWKRMAIAIGGTGMEAWPPGILKTPPGRWLIVCSSCKATSTNHFAPRRRLRCLFCGEPMYIYDTGRDRRSPPTATRHSYRAAPAARVVIGYLA